MKADTRSEANARQDERKEIGELEKGVQESPGEANKGHETNANHDSGSDDGSAVRGKARQGEADEHDVEENVPLTFPQRVSKRMTNPAN